MLTATTRLEDIKKQPVIAATREAYKRCGKDPGRYRPSAEALRRRLMRGIALYQIDTLVDLINLVSLRTGHSIGGFDADKIAGTGLELGIGKMNEPFEGIGRGVLNIEGLPVYRDAVGGIGTPTSDNERTKMGLETTHILAIVNGYNGKEGLQEAAEMIQTLLKNTLTRTEEQLLTLNNGYPHENIFTLLILSVCFCVPTYRAGHRTNFRIWKSIMSGWLHRDFFQGELCHAGSEVPVTELLFPFAGGQSHFGLWNTWRP